MRVEREQKYYIYVMNCGECPMNKNSSCMLDHSEVEYADSLNPHCPLFRADIVIKKEYDE